MSASPVSSIFSGLNLCPSDHRQPASHHTPPQSPPPPPLITLHVSSNYLQPSLVCSPSSVTALFSLFISWPLAGQFSVRASSDGVAPPHRHRRLAAAHLRLLFQPPTQGLPFLCSVCFMATPKTKNRATARCLRRLQPTDGHRHRSSPQLRLPVIAGRRWPTRSHKSKLLSSS